MSAAVVVVVAVLLVVGIATRALGSHPRTAPVPATLLLLFSAVVGALCVLAWVFILVFVL